MKHKISSIATFVRDNIVLHKSEGATVIDYGFRDFPRSCCDKASEILKTYLEDIGCTGFKYVHKRGSYKGKDYSHVWLENEFIAIDITGDQYNGKWKNIHFEPITCEGKGDYFFNKINEESSLYEEYFMIPSPLYFNYLEFYNRIFREKQD
ncbi:hypothetical protein K2X92_06170 [Candidatus Gracilibacteria bacterium]|nr:hypothetical protein [Candidatus Gracilibacteria bacterium]